jgi:iron complex transport system ATP-binding protein
MTRLAAAKLAIRRGPRFSLDSIDLEFAGGGFAIVIGPNGAGKSTLLAALAGLIAPDAGAITLDGAPLRAIHRRALARRRAYLPQNPHCEWPISVERVVALGLTPILPAFGDLPAAMKPRIDRALAACDLLALRDQPATTLSGGERARAMLARALVGEPDILIVDEPTAGLDPRHALEAMRHLRAWGESGRLVIAAAHDLSLAAQFADRLIALNGGRLIADGAVDAVLTQSRLRDVFDVEARFTRDSEGAHVRFLPNA